MSIFTALNFLGVYLIGHVTRQPFWDFLIRILVAKYDFWSASFKEDTKWKFLFSRMKVHEKHEWTPLTVSLIPYLVPEISTFKQPKHDNQNWLTANINNLQNCDAIRFACRSVSYKIDYNTASTHLNPLKLCEQKVARKIRSILIEFWSSK